MLFARAAALVIGTVVSQLTLPSAGQAREKYFPASQNGVPGHYGVTLFAVPAASAAAELVWSVGGELGYVYQHVLNGFQAELTEAQAELLSEHPWVRNVIQETYLEDPLSYTLPYCYFDFDTNTRPLPPLPGPGNPVQEQTLTCADPAPGADCIDNWGIDRLDQYGLPRDESFSYRQTAASVKILVIDTGVARDNREFADALSGTRVTNGIDAQCEDFPFNCNFGNVPCSLESPGSGHGTHVAAILGGRTFGIARDVNIVPIKALCENYTTEEVKQGFEAVLILHSAAQPTAVVNISGLNTQCFADPDCADGDQIRQALIAVASRDNILVVQSAGNQSGLQLQDACDYSFGDEGRYPNPDDAAAIARILIAAGSDEEDGRWRWQSGEPGEPSEQIGSNIGGCVDLFAPAAHIASAYFPVDPGPNDPNEIVCQLSGTSMAAPHVAGVAAMILQNDPRIGPETLRTRILNWAERDSLEVNPADPGYIGAGSPNLLLHWDPSAIMRDGFEAGDLRAWTETSP